MDQNRLVIVGANGQLGRALQERFPMAAATDRDVLDITDASAVANYDWSGVSAVINAAAYTNVDGAETEEGRQLAWAINATAVTHLVRAAQLHDLTLVHVSSEYVFDGQLWPHREDEPLTPLGMYGLSKAAGDIAAAMAPKHYILRTSWLIGQGHNFVRTMMALADQEISPRVVNDQIGRLTFTETLVDAIELLLDGSARHGTYNVSGGGRPASWAEIARQVFYELGREHLLVTDVSTAQYYAGKPGIAPRPRHSELDLAKLRSAGLQPPNWRDSLQTYLAREAAKR